MPAAGVAAALRGEHHWRRARGRAKPPRHGYAAAAHGSSASPEAAATAAATADATSDARTGVGTCPAPILDEQKRKSADGCNVVRVHEHKE
jgi:hypothetical protein